MFSKLSKILGIEPDASVSLAEGEEIVLEGRAERVRFGNQGWGFFVLTNRRILWHEPPSTWRSNWRLRELNLSDVASVDRGNLIHFLLGGRRLRLRLRGGGEYLFQGGIEDTLGEWVASIRRLIASEDHA